MNNVCLIGRLTREPELRATTSGSHTSTFSIAVNGYNDQTDFINIVVWNGVADNVCKYCHKGTQVGITGRISTRSYETESGTRYVTEVIANNVTFLGSKSESTPVEETTTEEDVVYDFSNEINDDDLPF